MTEEQIEILEAIREIKEERVKGRRRYIGNIRYNTYSHIGWVSGNDA